MKSVIEKGLEKKGSVFVALRRDKGASKYNEADVSAFPPAPTSSRSFTDLCRKKRGCCLPLAGFAAAPFFYTEKSLFAHSLLKGFHRGGQAVREAERGLESGSFELVNGSS